MTCSWAANKPAAILLLFGFALIAAGSAEQSLLQPGDVAAASRAASRRLLLSETDVQTTTPVDEKKDEKSHKKDSDTPHALRPDGDKKWHRDDYKDGDNNNGWRLDNKIDRDEKRNDWDDLWFARNDNNGVNYDGDGNGQDNGPRGDDCWELAFAHCAHKKLTFVSCFVYSFWDCVLDN